MMRVFRFIAVLLFWTAGNLLFLAWYHQMLGLDFSLSAGLVVAIVSFWIASVIYFFPLRVIHAALLFGYAVIAGWLLVNFAYFKTFATFLPIDSNRFQSLNFPMLELLSEYTYLIPNSLALAVLGLFIYLCLMRRMLRGGYVRPEVQLELIPGQFVRYAVLRHKRVQAVAFLLLGITVQIGVFFAGSAAIGAMKSEMKNGSLSPEDAIVKLGLIGFAFASETDNSEMITDEGATRVRGVSDPSLLVASTTNLESVKQSLVALAKNSIGQGGGSTRPDGSKIKHVIMYQVESGIEWPLKLSESAMPFLSSLMAKYGTVENYFANGCTTVDAEFAVNCGFMPETYGPISDLYSKNNYNCLPTALQKIGFSTSIYHANQSSFWNRDSLNPAWGFQNLNYSPVFKYREPDLKMMPRVISDLKSSSKPTYQYIIGMTGHLTHTVSTQKMFLKNYQLDVEPYSGDIGEIGHTVVGDDTSLRIYLGLLKATDDGIKALFDSLQTEGLMDSTAVVIFADHRLYGAKSANPVQDFFTYNQLPMLFYTPGMTQAAWPKVASHIDLAPTVYDLVTNGTGKLPETFLGTSLFSPAHSDVAVNKCLGRVSYFDGSTIALADIPLQSFKTLSLNGAATDLTRDASIKKELLNVALGSDLILARNALGEIAPTTAPESKEIRLESVTDSDHDGISDLREVGLGTDPHKADTDGDGYSDGEEISHGYNPLGPGMAERKTLD